MDKDALAELRGPVADARKEGPMQTTRKSSSHRGKKTFTVIRNTAVSAKNRSQKKSVYVCVHMHSKQVTREVIERSRTYLKSFPFVSYSNQPDEV